MSRTALVFVLLPWVLLAAIPATFVLGVSGPTLFIGNGVDSFEGAERAYAKETLHRVRRDLSGSGLVMSVLRVTEVEACSDDPYPDYQHISTSVEIYTIFGIYYDTYDVTCKGELVVPKHPDDGG